MIKKLLKTRVGEWQGESTDDKPVLQVNETGSTFYEVDTGKLYTWHIDEWVEVV